MRTRRILREKGGPCKQSRIGVDTIPEGMRYSVNIALSKIPNGNADCIYSSDRSRGSVLLVVRARC